MTWDVEKASGTSTLLRTLPPLVLGAGTVMPSGDGCFGSVVAADAPGAVAGVRGGMACGCACAGGRRGFSMVVAEIGMLVFVWFIKFLLLSIIYR